jgi:hypothetical protein
MLLTHRLELELDAIESSVDLRMSHELDVAGDGFVEAWGRPPTE